MPTIPRYSQQVEAGALPNARMTGELSDEAVGINASKRIGQAFQGLLQTGSDIYQQEKKKADDTRIDELDAQARKYKNELLYGMNLDGNEGDNGVTFRKGKEAFGAQAEFEPRYKAKLDELEAQAAGGAQREMFKRARARHEADLSDSIMRHTAGEAREYEVNTFKSTIESLHEDAIYNYQTPGAVKNSMIQQAEKVRQFGTNNGWDDTKIQNATIESFSKTNFGVITRMVDNGQYEQAMAHLGQNKALMTSEDMHRAKSVLESASVLGSSQKNATTIMSSAKSQVEALDIARKISDPKIQKATVDEIETRYAEQARAKKQRDDSLFQAASEHISKTNEIPPTAIWDQLDLESKVKLQDRIHQYRKGIEPNTNWNDYYYLKTMSSSPLTRDKFLQLNIDKEYRSSLDDAAFKELTGLQVAIRNRDENVIKELDGFRSNQEIVNSALNSHDIDPTPKRGSKDAKLVDDFRRQVDIKVEQYQNASGKKINNEEMQRIVDNLMIEGVTKKGFFSLFDSTSKRFELAPGQKFLDVGVKDIPRVERLKIEQALQKRNIPVTDDSIKSLYLQKINGAQ